MQNKNSFSAFIFSSFIYCLSCTLVFAQSAALLPNALQVYLDSNGNPLTGGTVTFYYPGTFNLKPIWKDSGEVTPWVNPITLDAAGRPPGGSGGVYGQGAYRQIVKDVNGNLQWDAVTSSAGSSSGIAATGDGDLVGTVKPWAGIAAPNQYQFAYGQQISRITFASLFTAITQSLTVVCSSASNTLTGISDTTSINIGAPIEVAACVAPGTTVSSKTASTVVMSNPSSVNLTTIATFFPFGNGDGSTTFTLPDFRGNVIAGRPNMGGNASSNLTTAFCPNAAAQGVVCGSQSKTLTQANLPNIVPVFTGNSVASSNLLLTGTGGTPTSILQGGGAAINQIVATTIATGTISSINGNVTQTAFSAIQPTLVMNYIIKVTPDTNSAIATGVTDLGGMTGSIACGTGISCTGNIITVTGSSVAAGGLNTQVQFNSSNILAGSANLTWVSPVLTIGVAGTATGSFAIAGSTSGIVTQSVQSAAGGATIIWGNTSGTPAVVATSPLSITTSTGNISCSTCAITTNPLSQFAATTSAQLAGVISDETGNGLAVFNTSPILVTPTLGAALATSINGLTLTSSTGTLTIAAAKTHVVNNSITMAGVDGSTLTFQATDTYVGRATTDTLTNKTLDTAGTGNIFKINGTSITAIGGTTAKVGTVAGVLVSGHCVSIDANLNFIDAGGACTTGGGGGTVNSGTANQLAYYGGTGTVVSGNANFTVSSGALTLGIGGSVQGSLALSGVTSGTTTFVVAAAASGTLTFPAATDTIVGRATTDTLTNKTLTSPIIATIVNSGTLTLPTSTDTLIGRATTDTLTNKTFDTAGTGNSFKIAGTSITSISGNTSKVGTTSGALTNNDCASFDASGNIKDNGTTCGAVASVANSDSTLTISPTTGAVVASLNLAHANTWTANQQFNNDVYFKSGRPFADVRAWGALCNGANDDAGAIQAALDYVYNNYVGGIVYIPPGNCKIASSLTVSGGVQIIGAGPNASSISSAGADIFMINFLGTPGATAVVYGGLSNIQIAGYTANNAATHNLVGVQAGALVIFRDCKLIGGIFALIMNGTDSLIENCFINGYGLNGGSIQSQGANWYIRDKLDTSSNTTKYGFFQTASIVPGATQENHFDQTDISGNFTYSVFIDDGNNTDAITIFSGSVFSAPIGINTAKFSSFVGNEFGSTTLTSNRPIAITGGIAVGSPITVNGTGTRSCAANISITC